MLAIADDIGVYSTRLNNSTQTENVELERFDINSTQLHCINEDVNFIDIALNAEVHQRAFNNSNSFILC